MDLKTAKEILLRSDETYAALTPEQRFRLFERDVQGFYLDQFQRLKYKKKETGDLLKIEALDLTMEFFRYQTFFLRKYASNLHWRLDKEDSEVLASVWIFYEGKEVRVLDIRE